MHDGRPDNIWHWHEEVRPEMDALWDNRLDPALTWAEHQDYKAKLSSLLKKGARGTVYVAEARGEAHVIRNTILELRPLLESTRPAFNRVQRHLRLYFGEPQLPDHALLALHLDTKGDAQSGLEEQNEAISESFRRADAWAAA